MAIRASGRGPSTLVQTSNSQEILMTTPKDNLRVNANLAEALEFLNGLGHRYAAEAR